MIKYDHQGIFGIVVCEECGETEDMHGSFKQVVDQMKADGWQFHHDDETNEWHHTCPDCV